MQENVIHSKLENVGDTVDDYNPPGSNAKYTPAPPPPPLPLWHHSWELQEDESE